MYFVMFYTPLEEFLLLQVLLHSPEQVKAPSNPAIRTQYLILNQSILNWSILNQSTLNRSILNRSILKPVNTLTMQVMKREQPLPTL